MNPNWLGVISAILAFIAFFVVYRVAKDTPAKKRILFALLASVAAIPGASFAAYYAHLLPEPSWYYQFRSLAGTELLIVFLGIAGGLVATSLTTGAPRPAASWRGGILNRPDHQALRWADFAGHLAGRVGWRGLPSEHPIDLRSRFDRDHPEAARG